MIHVRNLTKTFRVHKKEPGLAASLRSLFRRNWIEKRALDDVSFDVEEGEIVGLIGANGAGKTTLVKILSGIIHPSSGEVSVLDQIPTERSVSFRSQIALIMGQKAQLWWDLPAGDCFLLLKEIYGIAQSDYRERLDQLSGRLGVGDLLNIQIRRLSLGERMKMELIAALLHSPKVVFLDEPTIGLDLMSQKAIRNFILEYRTERRPAMILTSHYMEDIERLCERIIIIAHGKIIYDGSLKKIVSDYAKNKIVTARLLKGSTGARKILENIGEIVTLERDFLRIEVNRDSVPDAVNEILNRFEVIDLNIEEQGIASVIEEILKKP